MACGADDDPTAMSTAQPDHETLLAAVARILRPLVRVLIRNRVASDAVTELVRRVFVDVAFEEFALEGRRPTQSRVSVLTGLNRKEVARLRALGESVLPDAGDRRNRAAALLGAWRRDPDFHGPDGQPMPLPFSGEQSFTLLCQRHSGDMKPRSLADELVAAGALEEVDGKLRMTSAGYVPSADPTEVLQILGTDTAELISTIDHNLCAPAGGHRYQSKVKYEGLSAAHQREFLTYSGRRAQDLLEDLDRWLAARTEDSETAADSSEAAEQSRVNLGLAAFQIVEPYTTTVEDPGGASTAEPNP